VHPQYAASIPDSNFLHTWVGKPNVLFGSVKYLAVDVTMYRMYYERRKSAREEVQMLFIEGWPCRGLDPAVSAESLR
jgi:hypothetical protein